MRGENTQKEDSELVSAPHHLKSFHHKFYSISSSSLHKSNYFSFSYLAISYSIYLTGLVWEEI